MARAPSRGATTSWAVRFGNVAISYYSSVTGGQFNIASGNAASVSGGSARTAPDPDDWVAGALFEDN